MQDLLTEWTALPNLHPALVHLPIAILPLAVLVDAIALALRRRLRLDAAVATLYGLGALGLVVAFWAGRQAADSLVDVPAGARPLIGAHADWALYALWAFSVLAAVRAATAWRFRQRAGATPVPARVVFLVAALPGLAVLFGTADRGGALVYRHGVGVAAAALASGDPGRQPNGALLSVSGPGLVTLLVPDPSFGNGTTRWRSTPDEAPRPILEVTGPTLLTLPGAFRDVRLEARLELLDFEGAIGVGQSEKEGRTLRVFSMSTNDRAVLTHLHEGARDTLDTSAVSLPPGEFRLALSMAGRHWHGLLDGRSLVHGHAAPGGAGVCGIWLDGQGSLRLHSLSITRLGGSET